MLTRRLALCCAFALLACGAQAVPGADPYLVSGRCSLQFSQTLREEISVFEIAFSGDTCEGTQWRYGSGEQLRHVDATKPEGAPCVLPFSTDERVPGGRFSRDGTTLTYALPGKPFAKFFGDLPMNCAAPAEL